MPLKSETLKEFGSIQTQRNAQVKFYIDKFRNAIYANIREFIEGKNYKGFTRKGVKLNVEELAEIVEKTQNINLEDPSLKDKEIARIKKNSTKDIVVKAADYKGRVGLDIREWLNTEEYEGWTKNGVRFEPENYKKFMELITDMLSELKSMTSK